MANLPPTCVLPLHPNPPLWLLTLFRQSGFEVRDDLPKEEAILLASADFEDPRADHGRCVYWSHEPSLEDLDRAMDRGGLALLDLRNERSQILELLWLLRLCVEGESEAGKGPFQSPQERLWWATLRHLQANGPARSPLDRIRENRLQNLGGMAAGIVHELKTPLAVALHNIEHIERELQGALSSGLSGEELEDLMSTADEALMGLHRLHKGLNDLQSFATLDRNKSAVQVEKVLDLALGLTSNELKYKTQVHRPRNKPLPLLHLHQGRLSQTLVLLLQWLSRDLSPELFAHNHLTVEVLQLDRDASIRFHLQTNTSESLPRTQPPALCQEILQPYGGRLGAEEISSTEVLCEILLPLPAEALLDKAPRMTIALVDEDAEVRQALTRCLSRYYDVKGFAHGQDATANMARGERFDLLLYEINTQDLPGPALWKWVAEQGFSSPPQILFTSTGIHPPDTERFLSATGLGTFQKPVLLHELLQAIKDKLQKSPRRPPSGSNQGALVGEEVHVLHDSAPHNPKREDGRAEKTPLQTRSPQKTHP